ncbi:uncharacterized protein LOC125380975 [Haliotis rufescens]|uniref:uncharacterized protein LOC125380975 n=1 Tax=Haliotis rufescens TaxID=6454 RepID=UPI00201F2A93|nr:uncharacterized protein LOC125380975 [Haliotis rufescens]
MTQQLLQGMPGASRDCRKRDIPQERAKRRFIFYDFETAQDTGKHVPNLCVTHLGCGGCIGNKSDNLCDTCPWRAEGEGPSRVKVFKGASSLNDMGDWLLRVADGGTKKKGKKRKRQSDGDSEDGTDEGDDDDEEEAIIAIAHNYRGYDGHLLLQYLHKKIVKPPEILMRGQQILQMKVGRVTFKDSLNFLSMPLKNFPKTFGLSELQKGYFPHFFNTAANEDYVGPYPPVESYGADSMSITDREAFMKWYDGKIAQNAVFDMGEEILAYCLSDVDILRRGCAAFRQLFIDQNRVDPFKDAITLPMACMLVYRQNYLPENTIAIIPPLGYRPHVRYSIQSLQWLAWLMNVDATLDIQHSRNGGEMRFHCSNGKTYSVDGFDKKTKTVYEYLGCFWHGCARCYKTSRSKPHPTLGISMAETLHQTHFRLALLRNHPEVNAVVTIWECGFQGQTKENPELGNFLKGFEYLPMPLNPRDAFFGGRTNATKLFHEAGEDEKIMYVDVCSLYPYINKYGRYPVGHPKIVDKPDVSRLFDLHGLVMCRILPPKRLYHPLLPYRTCGKLMFPLCRTCADSQQQETCSHTDEERAWVGTYATVEVQEAVRECDYEVLHIFEAWHFEEFAQYDKDSRQGGLFTDYVNNFFKLKQEASGPPEQCENLQEYVQTIFDKEGVRLNEANVVKNPGLRMLGKACLNNFWGKLAQQESVTKSEYLSDPMTFFHMLLDESLRVQSVLVINDNLLFVSYEPENDYLTPHSASNVVIAAWVTAQARLKLYSYIKPLDRRVLYFDTDSVIYIHRAEEWNPPLGDSLGELTDELDGNTIKTFVSAGPKNYSYLLAKPRKDEASPLTLQAQSQSPPQSPQRPDRKLKKKEKKKLNRSQKPNPQISSEISLYNAFDALDMLTRPTQRNFVHIANVMSEADMKKRKKSYWSKEEVLLLTELVKANVHVFGRKVWSGRDIGEASRGVAGRFLTSPCPIHNLN